MNKEFSKMEAKIVEVSISKKKGVRKENIPEGLLIENFGLKDDAHAGDWHRQVSLLAMESIEKIKAKGLDVGPGDFAENITTIGINLVDLPIGTRLKLGDEVLMEVTQIGKECHSRCAIFYQAGDCVMPREGIFAKVLNGGKVRKGDPIIQVGS
jgi:MOSC domain-containing protein YiiM